LPNSLRISRDRLEQYGDEMDAVFRFIGVPGPNQAALLIAPAASVAWTGGRTSALPPTSKSGRCCARMKSLAWRVFATAWHRYQPVLPLAGPGRSDRS
jgi:hypothetical protein